MFQLNFKFYAILGIVLLVIGGVVGYKIMLDRIANQAEKIEQLEIENSSLKSMIERIKHDIAMRDKEIETLNKLRQDGLADLEKARDQIEKKVNVKRDPSGNVTNVDEIKHAVNEIQTQVYDCIKRAGTQKNEDQNSVNPLCPSY